MDYNQYKPYVSQIDRIRAKLIDYYKLPPSATPLEVEQETLRRAMEEEQRLKDTMSYSNKKQILDAYN